MTEDEILDSINKHVSQCGWGRHGWYAGITDDRDRRLFTEHKVDKENDAWISCPADSEAVAREVERSLVAGQFHGGTGGGPHPAIVYAYRITSQTDENA